MADQIRTDVDWEDVRIFVTLARHGSLSTAARALKVTHATISRRIQALERSFGEKLVERRPDGYVLTPAGTRLLAPASEMESAAEKFSRTAKDAGPNGLVRVNAPPSLTQAFLVAQLAQLSAHHPALDIDVASDYRSVSLERRETDIALRFGRPLDGDVQAKLLTTIGFGFYASAGWRQRVARGASPVFVGFDEANAHLPEAAWLARHFPRARIAFRADGQLAQAVAAKAGAGIAMLPHFVARTDRTLRLCELDHTPPSRELWLLRRRQDPRDTAVRVVVDFLVQIFSAERERFEHAPQ